MRAIVCGGRNYRDRKRAYAVLDAQLLNPCNLQAIIVGGANGADRLAVDWAFDRNLSGFLEIFPAHWDWHGKAAGPKRNQQMLDEGKPDLVIAFPGGRGTADMVARAEKAGVKVIRVDQKGATL